MRRRFPVGLLRTGLALAIVLAARWPVRADTTPCPPDPAMPALSLPHLRAAMAAEKQGIIVALGSSSTEGARASSIGETYPAELQDMLSAALPDWHVAVINRGIGGQDAPRETARIAADVIAIRPQAVIWQVGANAALHDADPERFRRLVTEGTQRMRAAGIDVVLMDNQRTPRLLAATEDGLLDHTLAEVARATGASLFSRDRLMRGWQRSGAALAAFTASDGLHHNDRGYSCLARALGRAILNALAAPKLSASR